jgi:hypothetical protein
MKDYSLKDNAAISLNLGKGRNMHNFGCQTIKNSSRENKLIMMGFGAMIDSHYSNANDYDIHGKNFYLNFFNSDVPFIKNLYNQYIGNTGMKIFIPKNIPNPYYVIQFINNFGAENAGYVIFNDCIVPNFLNYNDKQTLSQLPPP